MWFKIRQHISFLLKSTNQHGVHSPFVYQLITQCFYNKSLFQEYKPLKTQPNQLLSNHDATNLDTRKKSQPVNDIGITPKRAKLLSKLVKYGKIQNVLELGTSLGQAPFAMYLANPKIQITTIENPLATTKNTQPHLKAFQFNTINLKLHHLYTTLKHLKPQTTFNLIYINSNHKETPTIQYFKTLLQHIDNNSIIIFNDIYWSRPMLKTWRTIKKHPKVKVSIDTFFWGILFFRKEQAKEHFYH